jgi:hypothetical protein
MRSNIQSVVVVQFYAHANREKRVVLRYDTLSWLRV